MLYPANASEAIMRHPSAQVVPVVADANVLIRDVCANLRRPAVTALLGQLEAGMVRVLITPRVAHEVETRMVRVARDQLRPALDLWHTRYRPQVRVVDPDIDEETAACFAPLLARVRDTDDAPTAQLALLCAPCLVVTSDNHLLRAGFGAPEWLQGLRASGELSDLDRSLWMSAQLTGAVLQESVRGLAAAARALTASPWVLGLVLGVAFFAVTEGRPTLVRARRAVGGRTGDAALGLARFAEALAQQRALRQQLLGPHLLPPLHAPPPVTRLVARLASAPQPLPLAVLASELPELPVSHVRVLLQTTPGFCVARGRGWQLGG
jgi:hypothetical protein